MSLLIILGEMNFLTILQTTLRFWLLMAPFFAITMFLYLTKNFSTKRRQLDASKIAFSSFFLCIILIFFGQVIFNLIGITLHAFRVGVGIILLLDGISLVKGKIIPPNEDNQVEDIVIVPMTIPVLIGPAVIGTLMVISTELTYDMTLVYNLVAITISCFLIWLCLFLATSIEKYLGAQLINILSKMTGLYLAALASQMIVVGIKASLL